MKFCIVSEYSWMLDEGMRNMAYYLWRELSQRHKVLHISLKPLFMFPFLLKRIYDYNPQLIHVIPGPTLKTFLLAKLLKIYYPKAKIVMSATNPVLGYLSKRLVPLLKPDLILAQTEEDRKMFMRFKCYTRILHSGVDTNKFIPVSSETKSKLRAKFGLDPTSFIALHIGPIRYCRNLLLFNKIRKRLDIQPLIIGSQSTPMEQDVLLKLVDEGCLVWVKYFKAIQEIYALADCYVFPTFKEGCSIKSPLSVLEAMSSNLPVITMKFGALPQMFHEGHGLYFVNGEDEIIPVLKEVMDKTYNHAINDVKTREKVLPYSWRSCAQKLERLYAELFR